MPKIVLFFSVLCAFVFLPGCWNGISHDVLATVLSVHGPVTCAPSEARETHIVDLGARLGNGASLQVPTGAEVDLALLPGVLLSASDNTNVVITELKLIKDGDETGAGMRGHTAGIRLRQGRATLSYEHPDQAPGSVAVVTDHAVVKAQQDALFCIETDKVQTRILCVRGQIDVLNNAGEASVIKGGWLQICGVTSSESISLQLDARSHPKIQAALQVEQQLRSFEIPNASPIR